MKKVSCFFVVLFIFTIFLPIPKAKSDESSLPTLPIEKISSKEKTDKEYKEGEVIIRYKSKTKKEKSLKEITEQTEKKDLSLEIKGEIDDLNMALIKSTTKSTQDLIDEFENDTDIEFIEPNYKKNKTFTPNDTYYPLEWVHYNSGQSIDGVTGTADADVDSTEAWDIESNSASDTIVAIIDDGVEYDHTDLISNMWDGTSCVDDLGNTISGGCPNHGWDYESIDNNPYGTEHGTFIASLIAGENNNNSGIAGISRYNNIKLMALKFDFTVFTELQAINFARENDAKVINASFAGTSYSISEKFAIDNFDGIFVAAAGNEAVNNESTPSYPCNYTSDNIICVGSSTQNDGLSSFSNYGTTSVDIMAPGENMIGRYSGTYYIGDGTSFATPIVAGATALLYAHRPTASISTIRDTLLYSSDHKSAISSKIACGRRLNINTALQSIIDNDIPTETCTSNKVAAYRFYNAKSDAHLFTINADEKDWIIATLSHAWKYEGIAFYAYANQESNTSPVYRFYNATHDVHFFTISSEERDWVIATLSHAWKYEGIVYYAYKNETAGTIPAYRFYNAKSDAHLFTINADEKDWIIATLSHAWKYEGIAYYVPE